MNRRNFISNAALFTAPLLLKGLPIYAAEKITHPFLAKLAEAAVNNGNILVVVQMTGGNDGLNTIIPIDKYSILHSVRKEVLIPANKVLPLAGTIASGMHPSMPGLKRLYDEGKVNIVQGVSYPNPSFSHFRSQDILFTGANFDENLNTGWAGRALNKSFAGFPVNYPTTELLDPPAIQIGGSASLALQGTNTNMGYSVSSVNDLQNVINAKPNPAPASNYGDELTFLRQMKDQSNGYTGRIKTAYNGQNTRSSKYPSYNYLADQLQLVARLIGGGLNTPLYIVNHPDSFDTHSNQVDSYDATTGSHAKSLQTLSSAIATFQDDITLMGRSKKVVGMTFTEFGRRIYSNTSFGTDHGTAFPIIFFGDGVKSGILGESETMPDTINENSQMSTIYDFRQVYSSILQDWLGFSNAEVQGNVLNGNFETISIFNKSMILPITGFKINASWSGNYVKLDFEIFDNDNQLNYEIERSTDLLVFKKVKIIENNSDNSVAKYSYFDERISSSEIYYKVIAVAKNGKRVESKIVALKNNDKKQLLSVFPNPIINQTINIDFFRNISEIVEISIIGPLGDRNYYNQIKLTSQSKITFQVQNVFQKNIIYLLNVKFGLQSVIEKIIFN